MALVESYWSLTSSDQNNIERVLKSLTNATPSSFTLNDRDKIVTNLLINIRHCLESPVDEDNAAVWLTRNHIGLALSALKSLGRAEPSSKVISETANLKILLTAAEILLTTDENAMYDALRCIANALLLVDEGRARWVDVGGGDYCASLLDKTESVMCMFLACRILFLSTASSISPLHSSLLGRAPSLHSSKEPANHNDIVTVISQKLDFLLACLLKGVPMSREAMTDLLKFTFNLLCHWPKIAPDSDDHDRGPGHDTEAVLGERWSSRLDGLLPPLRQVFLKLPRTSPSPLSAPVTHALHALMPIPINETLYPSWFPENEETRSGSDEQKHGSSSSDTPDTPHDSSPRPGSPYKHASHKGKGKEGESRGALDRALSMLTPRMSLSSRSPSPASPVVRESNDLQVQKPRPEILVHSLDLFEASLAHYLPGNIDPDDPSVRRICMQEDVQLDHVLTPLVLLLSKLCKSDVNSRVLFRKHVIPETLDRTSPLEGHPDTLGRCIRLMGCVGNTQLKDAVGELLFVACDSDAQALSAQIGYGNAAGFLFNKGVLSPPSATSTSGASSVDSAVNPITGMIQQEAPPGPEMTDEEKEREAEKLFVLFERLEKAGGMENPIKKALHEGKLEKYMDRSKPDE